MCILTDDFCVIHVEQYDDFIDEAVSLDEDIQICRELSEFMMFKSSANSFISKIHELLESAHALSESSYKLAFPLVIYFTNLKFLRLFNICFFIKITMQIDRQEVNLVNL